MAKIRRTLLIKHKQENTSPTPTDYCGHELPTAVRIQGGYNYTERDPVMKRLGNGPRLPLLEIYYFKFNYGPVCCGREHVAVEEPKIGMYWELCTLRAIPFTRIVISYYYYCCYCY